MLEFLEQNWPIIVAAVGAAGIIFAFMNSEVARARAEEFLYAYEAKFRKILDQEQDVVVTWITNSWYSFLPKYVRLFIPKNKFRKILNAVYGGVLNYLKTAR